jgi:DNA-binding response OmpR family regulator
MQGTRVLRVLIVDDDASTRSGLCELLSTAGYTTYGAAGFVEGVQALRDYAPDLLIADIRLGSYNGLHLLILAPDHVQVIIMTGFDDPILEREAREHGAEYVVKPLSPPAFVQLVRRCVDRTRPRRRTPRPPSADDQAELGTFLSAL